MSLHFALRVAVRRVLTLTPSAGSRCVPLLHCTVGVLADVSHIVCAQAPLVASVVCTIWDHSPNFSDAPCTKIILGLLKIRATTLLKRFDVRSRMTCNE